MLPKYHRFFFEMQHQASSKEDFVSGRHFVQTVGMRSLLQPTSFNTIFECWNMARREYTNGKLAILSAKRLRSPHNL